MPSIKKSVMLSEQTQNYIAARHRKEDDDDNYLWSQGVNGAVHALTWMLDQSLPELTEYEWQCVLNTFNGTMFDDTRIQSFLSLSSRMMDDIGAVDINDVEQKYADVVRKMHTLSTVEQYAIADMCRKFWAHGRKEETILEMIAALRGT